MDKKYKINPASGRWLDRYSGHIAGYFEDLGFHNLKEVLDLRVYDLMNMNRVDPGRAEEILVSLYRFFNHNPETDEAIRYGAEAQSFDYAAWRKKYGKYDEVRVRDLVLEEDINMKALLHLYGMISKSFFKSDEYDSRNYRWQNYREYRQAEKEQVKQDE